MALTLKSPAFDDGERIPDQYARDGANLSPPLDWEGAPDGTKSYVLVVEDPDAPDGTFRHWAAYGIPANKTRLEEGAGGRGGELKQGANDFGNPRYDGPQPPEGHGTHRYVFRLAALDTDRLDVEPQQKADAVWQAAQDALIDQAQLIGTYER